jgi:hypothetical protein
MKRPGVLTIAGAIWFIVGMLGVLGGAGQHGVQFPDGNMLNMLVGFGLWRGWRLCRLYAVFMCGFGFLMMVAGTPWALCHTEEMVYHYPVTLAIDQRPHDMMSFIGVFSYLAIGMFATGWMWTVLRRPDVRQFFKRQPVAIRAAT